MLSKAQIDNLKELYNNLQRDIQEASGTISGLRGEIKKLVGEKGKLEDEISEGNNILLESNARLSSTLSSVREAEQDFKVKKSEQVKYLEGIQELITRAEFSYEGVISRIKNKLDELETISFSHAESKESFNKINGEVSSLNLIHQSLNENVKELLLQYSEAQKSIESLRVESQKEITSLISQRRAVEAEIEEKQRSLDGFQENKIREEERMNERQRDLNVLEARLRLALESNNIPFKL